jgi:prepilin-type N-terminal cleavage/methylation domain-containing protein
MTKAQRSRDGRPAGVRTLQRGDSGFSLVELLIVVIVVLVMASFAIPNVVSITRNARNSGDARSISAGLNLARMRAAADFTHARLYADLANNSFHVESWNKAGGCWQTDGDSNSCTQTTSPVIALDTTDTFGYGSITSGPTAATNAIAQAPLCTTGVASSAPGATITNTACIEFNSRSFPVDSTNKVVASDAIYITDNQTFFSAIAVAISGQPASFKYSGSAWTQF